MLNGVLYASEGASALIDNQIVREGETIYGVEVVRIKTRTVEFKKGDRTWEQRVKERPDPAWNESSD